jgi:hypothetical protein
MRSVSLRSTKLPTTGLDQQFINPNYSATCFSMRFNYWTLVGKTKSIESNLTPLLHLNFKQEWFGDCSRSNNKIFFLWNNLVLVEERKVFFNIPLFFCCDTLKIFQVLLLGHDPAVEKPWSRPFCLIKLYILLFVNWQF